METEKVVSEILTYFIGVMVVSSTVLYGILRLIEFYTKKR
jgi:hypothetical protein